ncbi:MAG: glycosyltransferase family 2 protein [Candidatus Limnocylindrales bacterium]
MPHRDRPPRAGVVLVNWNTSDLTRACIQSLNAGLRTPDLIVVVDNGSSEDLTAMVGAGPPGLELIANRENVGFAGANNQGLSRLLDAGMDYLWILNNDTWVKDDCLAVLLDVAERHPEGACFSGKIYYERPPDRIWYAGGWRHPVHCAPKHYVDDRLDGRARDGVVDVEFISGCSMFVRREVLERFGGFLWDYCAYSEDNEWCWRLRKAGQRLMYVPAAVLRHRLSASVRRNAIRASRAAIPERAYFLMVRNNLWTVRQHVDSRVRRVLVLLVSVGLACKVALLCLARGEWRQAGAVARAAVLGLALRVPSDRSWSRPVPGAGEACS